MDDKDVNLTDLARGTCARGGQKDGPATMECQAFVVKSINQEKRQITAIASTESLDRDGEIILPSAFKNSLPAYMKNPVILACHHHRLQDGKSPVVGKAVRAWIEKKSLFVIIEFAETELAKEYWHLYSNKYQRALSVGFRPKQWEDELRGGQRVRVYKEVELLEISCVPIGSNPDALSRSAKRKRDFVASKRADTEDAILAELRREDPDFDKKADEFGLAMHRLKHVDGELVETDEFDCIEDVPGFTEFKGAGAVYRKKLVIQVAARLGLKIVGDLVAVDESHHNSGAGETDSDFMKMVGGDTANENELVSLVAGRH